MNKIQWSKYNGLILKNYGKIKPDTIFVLCTERAKTIKDKTFLEKGNLQKLKWQIDNLKKNGKLLEVENIEISEKPKTMNNVLLDLEKENIKKQKQNNFLKKHFREELSISSVRNSIIESLNEKIKKQSNVIENSINYQNIYRKENNQNLILEHIITDIHLNEVVNRKMGKSNWSTEIGLKDLEKTINLLIDKQNGQFKSIQLLLLGDLIGTTIHEGLELDIEPIRAASFLASGLSQSYFKLKEHFQEVKIVIIPGNHSETRKYGNKTDTFNENYDFIVGEKLKEMLSVFNWDNDVISPIRDVPLIARKLGKYHHVYIHGDRFNNNFKNLLSIMEMYYNTHYIDYLHEGHFHTEKIRYEDDYLKLTYPCFCQPSTYGFNRIGVTNRESQNGNIYSNDGEMIQTYSIDIDNEKITGKKENYLEIKFNLDNDLSEIFKETIKRK